MVLRHHLACLAALLASTATGGCARDAIGDEGAGAAGASAAPEGFWATWGDGRAEVNGYALTQARYGELRPGEAVLVFVAETFTAAQRVKSDGGHTDEFPVLKVLDSRNFQTGIYDYRVVSSAFLRLDGRQPLGLPSKVSLSVQEWCGAAYDQILVDEGGYRRILHSYFDGEADQSQQGPLKRGGVFADAVPALVRGLVGEWLAPGQTRTVPYLTSLLEARFSHTSPAWTEAVIHRSEDVRQVDVPAGFYEAYDVEVAVKGGLVTTWTVQAGEPHRVLAWRRSDGEQGTLLGSTRMKYWEEHKQGDEALRRELGLPARTWPVAN